jgi:hypothetical protein
MRKLVANIIQKLINKQKGQAKDDEQPIRIRVRRTECYKGHKTENMVITTNSNQERER